jgi:hypothetical protein
MHTNYRLFVLIESDAVMLILSAGQHTQPIDRHAFRVVLPMVTHLCFRSLVIMSGSSQTSVVMRD